ncbi:MAG: sn-glycerol-3-phosphate ABC transporter ATP-binding protein UgpC [bacterium]
MGQIALKGITRNFGAVEVLKGIDLSVADGELVVFVGPSGCGKSTLLRMIAGLDKPTSGTIEINGTDVTALSAADRGLAMVFQSYALYPHMTVKQNMAFGLQNTHMPKAEIETRIADAARLLEIEPLLARRPGQLSGGQRQRVAIGRAIVRRPTAFLLDEPLSNLDAELRVSMRAELSGLHARLAATMIHVTHDQVEAMTMADRIVVLRAGRVEQVDTPLNLYNRPANLFVAGFIGAPGMNLWPVEAKGDTLHLAGGQTIALKAAPGPYTIGLRPQRLRLAAIDDAAALGATVTLVEALGAESVVHATLDPGGARILAVLPGQPGLKRGDTIRLSHDTADLHLFDAKGARV